MKYVSLFHLLQVRPFVLPKGLKPVPLSQIRGMQGIKPMAQVMKNIEKQHFHRINLKPRLHIFLQTVQLYNSVEKEELDL